MSGIARPDNIHPRLSNSAVRIGDHADIQEDRGGAAKIGQDSRRAILQGGVAVVKGYRDGGFRSRSSSKRSATIGYSRSTPADRRDCETSRSRSPWAATNGILKEGSACGARTARVHRAVEPTDAAFPENRMWHRWASRPP